jgi:hypothetical protein
MTDTPERIWARPVGTVRDWNHTCGPWSLDNPYGSSVEYIRADIAEAEKRAAVEAAVEVARQAVWDAFNGSQQAEQLCDAIDAAIRQGDTE